MLQETLKNIRKELKLSQVEMAAMIDIQPVRYGYYESGKRNPKADFYRKFKEVFKIDLLLTNEFDPMSLLDNKKKIEDSKKQNIVTIDKVLPELLGEIEEKIIMLQSYAEVHEYAIAEIQAKSSSDDVMDKLALLRNESRKVASRRFHELQLKLVLILIFYLNFDFS